MQSRAKTRFQAATGAVLTLIGAGLVAIKIPADSEPGAIPLLLILVGLALLVAAGLQRRRAVTSSPAPAPTRSATLDASSMQSDGGFRGGVRHAALWSATFALIGGVLAALVVSDAPSGAPPGWQIALSLIVRFALFGLLCGALFWWVTGLLVERDRFARLGRLPVVLCGAIGTAAFVPLFMQTMNLLSGDGLVAWGLVLDDSVWAFFFGGAAALGSLEMARRQRAVEGERP